MLFRVLSMVVGISLILPQVTFAQTHVTASELENAISRAAGTRQKNLDTVRSFLASDPVQAAVKSARIDQTRLDSTVSTLNADELQRLASRVQTIQADFAAGALTNQELTYIIIALVTAVVILVVVAA